MLTCFPPTIESYLSPLGEMFVRMHLRFNGFDSPQEYAHA